MNLPQYWSKIKSVKAAVKETRKLAQENDQAKPEMQKRFDYITDRIRIYNKPNSDLSIIPDKSVQNICSSPPYYKMRPAQEDIVADEEIGREATLELYIQALVTSFGRCKRVMTEDGTCWVNLMDVVRDGCYQLVPEKFMAAMVDDGWICSDKLYWVKTNGQPGDGDNSFQNVEYLMKFSLCQNPYTDYTWLNETSDFKGNSFGKGPGIKLASFVNLKQGFVTTSGANTSRLREACEKEGFYLDHTSTYPLEIPYVCIKLSSKKGSHLLDIFSGTSTTAKASLYAEMGLTYHGFEINKFSVRASKVNIEMDFEKQPCDNTIPFIPNQDIEAKQAA